MIGTAEVLLPAMDLERVAEYLMPMAEKASVPVCVHYDHGLTFERIDVISNKTDLPLVLHGGSGLADDDFRTAVKLGVSKVNIFTDIDKAGKAGVEEGIAAGAKTMMGLIPYEINAMKKVVEEKMRLFGSAGHA